MLSALFCLKYISFPTDKTGEQSYSSSLVPLLYTIYRLGQAENWNNYKNFYCGVLLRGAVAPPSVEAWSLSRGVRYTLSYGS
jgi:hypothetical protein